jgi:glutamate--cysteine ligase
MIKEIKLDLLQQYEKVEQWIKNEYLLSQPVIYSSVDIRNSHFKSAHVDNNLFPAGFNNFSNEQLKIASVSFKNYIEKNFPQTKKIIILPEFHTRNPFYIDNLLAIKKIIEFALFEVRFIFTDLQEKKINLVGAKNDELTIDNYNIIDGEIILNDGFKADLLLVNNDMSGGTPDFITNLSIPVVPNIINGWQHRSKYNHFMQYKKLIHKFCTDFGYNDFFLSTEVEQFKNINFRDADCLKDLAVKIDEMIAKISKNYKEHGINDQPYLFIKADNGTYGMGIMTVNSGADILNINKKIRIKLQSLKNGLENSTILLQEGVTTIDNIDGYSAEPMVYLMNCDVFGQVYRVHKDKNNHGNLNSKGMFFSESNVVNKENIYLNSVLSRLSTIAAGRES